MINLQYNQQEEILTWEFKDSVNTADILESFELIAKYSETKKRLRIYCDALNYKLEIKQSELIKINKKALLYIPLFESFRLSVAVNNPKATAFFMLIFMTLKSNIFTAKVFSTESAAKKWLKE